MRIKRHTNGNEYLLVPPGVWVRNFTRAAPYIDINNLTQASDYHSLIDNHLKNVIRNDTLYIDTELGRHPNVAIVSDGYNFEKKQQLLETLPANVMVLGVNRSLTKWNVKGNRAMNYYVVNNPYPECKSYLPTNHRYYPPCIASVRTNPEFIKRYRASILRYIPTPEERFLSMHSDSRYYIDDYRNPICAAIGIAYRVGAVRLLLFCCDDVFADERPGAEQLPNGLWLYPQHKLSHALIEGNFHWLSHQDGRRIRIGNHSSGPDYTNAPYIHEEGLHDFFTTEL